MGLELINVNLLRQFTNNLQNKLRINNIPSNNWNFTLNVLSNDGTTNIAESTATSTSELYPDNFKTGFLQDGENLIISGGSSQENDQSTAITQLRINRTSNAIETRAIATSAGISDWTDWQEITPVQVGTFALSSGTVEGAWAQNSSDNLVFTQAITPAKWQDTAPIIKENSMVNLQPDITAINALNSAYVQAIYVENLDGNLTVYARRRQTSTVAMPALTLQCTVIGVK